MVRYYSDVIAAIEAIESDLVDVEAINITPLIGATVYFHKNERMVDEQGDYNYRDIMEYVAKLIHKLSPNYTINLGPSDNFDPQIVPMVLFIY